MNMQDAINRAADKERRAVPGLTEQQSKLLRILTDREAAGEPTPSFEEMKQALGLHSKSGVHRLIAALEERGHIERLPNRARSIVVTAPEPYRAKALRDVATRYLTRELRARGWNVSR